MSSPDGSEEIVGREEEGPDFGSDFRDPVSGSFVDWLTNYGETIGTALVESSVYLTAIAMTEVAIIMVLLGIPANPAPVLVALVTFAVYTSDHLADDPMKSPRAAFVSQHSGLFNVMAAFAYGFAVAIAAFGGPLVLFITLLPGAFWIIYASGEVPLLGIKIRRLKRTLLLNTAMVALAWALSLTMIPVAFANRSISTGVAAVFGYFFLRSLVDTIIPNIRDLEADRKAGVSTIPVQIGIQRTRYVLYGLDMATAGLIGFAMANGILPTLESLALLVGVAYSLLISTLLGRGMDADLLAVASEFEYIVIGMALVPVVYGI